MITTSQRPKGCDDVLSSLNMAVDALNLARDNSGFTLAKAAFGSASDLLALIRDSTIDEADYVELGLTCADVCNSLNRGMGGRRVDQLSQSVLEAIDRLAATVGEAQKNIVKRRKRNIISRLFHAKDDKEAIAIWSLELDRVLHVFDNEFVTNTHHDVKAAHDTVSDVNHNVPNTVPNVPHDVPYDHPVVSEVLSGTTNTCPFFSSGPRDRLKSRKDAGGQNQATHGVSAPGESPPPQPEVFDLHRNMLEGHEGTGGQPRPTQLSVLGELPPSPPRAFFGRDELIEKIVGLAEGHTPIALIGAGGVGKTSIVLTVLHHARIKQRFGDDRRFIRCDQFPASRIHFLRHLSKVIGAGIENPEDLAPLRRYLSSKEMIIVLDNAESILGLQGTNAKKIYTDVEELARFDNICLCITSRISTIHPDCETLTIPTLSSEAASETFCRIYKHGKQSDLTSDILKQLDFHPLSITLLATVAQHNQWDANRLTREWKKQRTGVLCAQHLGSLATTIELSLASPMFQELGSDARGLLGVIAFFPQGVDEKNIDWLFPSVSGGQNMFDRFCTLSLTYRTNEFITMLAPLRDYLRPKDPTSSPLLCTAKERYFNRLSADVYPDKPGFEKSRWITSEDANVEHLLDIFTSIDPSSKDVWDTCAKFMCHLYWHKPRCVMLGPKIEALPDDHPSKTQCLHRLSRLFHSVGNWVERKRLLTYALKLGRERGRDYEVARALGGLSGVNRRMGLREEGMEQAREASEIFERLGRTVDQAECLMSLAGLLRSGEQFDAAEESATRAIGLLPEKDAQLFTCKGHRTLGEIYRSRGDMEKAIHHFELTLGIASSFNMVDQLFWAHFALADLFYRKNKFNDARDCLERAESVAVEKRYLLAHRSRLHAKCLYGQRMFEEAKSEALCALHAFEGFGAANLAEETRRLLDQINRDARKDGWSCCIS